MITNDDDLMLLPDKRYCASGYSLILFLCHFGFLLGTVPHTTVHVKKSADNLFVMFDMKR